MSIQYIKAHTINGVLDASYTALARAQESQRPAALVVPSHAWAQQRKLQLKGVFPVGVGIQTHRHWIAGLWDVYGDGSTLIEPAARKVLLRPLIKQVGLLGSSPSPKLVADLAQFVEEAIAPGLTPSAPLSESQARVMELVSLYEHKLTLEGHIELAQAEAALLQTNAFAKMSVVYERPDLYSAHLNRFIGGLGGCAHVTIVNQELAIAREGSAPHEQAENGAEPELEGLRRRLFTGVGGLQASGHVHVGEAHGAHVASSVAARLVRRLHEQEGVEFRDMVICPGGPESVYPRLLSTLAREGVPFATRLALPCARTGLGGVFYATESVVSNPEDEETYEQLVDFICSPYSGVRRADARALQMRWRERAHSTASARLEDLRVGFAQGNATAAMMVERLNPAVEILDAARDERIRLMFENARKAALDVDTLIDDRAAAEALLDYLELCKRYLCEPDINEMANLPVTLSRAYGEPEDALIIASPGDLALGYARAIILTDLDAGHYPMSAQGGPFDALMELLGIGRPDVLANKQRLFLLNAIENCTEHFALCRATRDTAGEENGASALFEEVMAAFRSAKDEEADLPPQGVPSTLAPWQFSMSEADSFICERGADPAASSFERGMLAGEQSCQNLAMDIHGKPMPFSPTALEDYYRCPYRWFACRRVGYNGMDNEFDAASQGNFVHAVMERFYKDLNAAGHVRVTPQNFPEALAIAAGSFDMQLEHDKARARGGLYLRTQRDEKECEELRKLVLSLVERDAQFLPDFTPTYFELTLGKGTGNMLEYAGVPVRGKVDRVDVDAEGNAVIIDYKLSSLAAGYGFGKEEELPLRIQTDIYATLVQRHFETLGTPLRVVGSVYRSYSKNAMRGVYTRGIAWGSAESVKDEFDALPRSTSSETYNEYLVRVEGAVATCMESLKAGDIAPNPIAKGVCEFCKALSFCPKGGA